MCIVCAPNNRAAMAASLSPFKGSNEYSPSGDLEPTHRIPLLVEIPDLKASKPRAKSAMVSFLSFYLYERQPRITFFRAYILAGVDIAVSRQAGFFVKREKKKQLVPEQGPSGRGQSAVIAPVRLDPFSGCQ